MRPAALDEAGRRPCAKRCALYATTLAAGAPSPRRASRDRSDLPTSARASTASASSARWSTRCAASRRREPSRRAPRSPPSTAMRRRSPTRSARASLAAPSDGMGEARSRPGRFGPVLRRTGLRRRFQRTRARRRRRRSCRSPACFWSAREVGRSPPKGASRPTGRARRRPNRSASPSSPIVSRRRSMRGSSPATSIASTRSSASGGRARAFMSRVAD